MDHKDLCEHTRIRLIAAAVGHQQCTKTEANVIQLPGTDRVIAIGAPAQVRALLADGPTIPAQVPAAEVRAQAEPTEPLTIALGQGLIEIGQGHQGDERLPAILFGRNGAGAVGVETEGNRIMEPGECIAAVTFENYQSLDVVVEKLGELRMRIWPDAPHSQLSYGAAPHYRGYAHLGIGAYILNHSAAGEPPELAISIATEAQKAGRVVGDMRDNEPGELVQSKDIAVRLRFENVAGLDALEQQLHFVRSEHFAQQSTADKACEVRAAEWISVEDERKPEAGKPVLMFVRTLTCGEDDDGRPYETEGTEVAMGEYRKSHGYDVHYFDCYTSPMSDNDCITHWMPLPAAPSTADSANTGALGEKGADK